MVFILSTFASHHRTKPFKSLVYRIRQENYLFKWMKRDKISELDSGFIVEQTDIRHSVYFLYIYIYLYIFF